MNETALTQKEAYRMMLKDYPDVINLEQMCSILRISTKTGYKLLKEKKVDALKVGRAYRIPKLHILSYLNIGNESPKEN
jgi:excisionase family DNA binding protein